MTTDFRALCADLLWALENAIRVIYHEDGTKHISTANPIVNRARAALGEADEPAVPEGREPAAVTGQPSDEEWDALVERVWDKYQTVGYQGERFMYDGDFGSALDLVRKELSLWGNPVPAPPVEGEWQTGLPSFAGFYYVRGLLDESIGGDNRPVYVNPKHFVWGFWEQDDPEWIGLDSDITPDNIQWKPVAPLPSPVADGEVAELVAELRMMASQAAKACQFTDAESLSRAADLLKRQATACAICERERLHQSTRAADLEVERHAPVPVAVSERLPGPEVCVPHPRTKRGNWCWGFERCDVSLARPARWRLMHMETVEMEASHWLPAHSLPLPEVGE